MPGRIHRSLNGTGKRLPAETQSVRETQETYPGERRAGDRITFDQKKEESM